MSLQKPLHPLPGVVLPFVLLILLVGQACMLEERSKPSPATPPGSTEEITVIKTYSGPTAYTQSFFEGETTCANQHQATLTLTSDNLATLDTTGKSFTYGINQCQEDTVITAFTIKGIWISTDDGTEITFKDCNGGVMTATGDATIQAAAGSPAVGSVLCVWPDLAPEAFFEFTLAAAP
jgi:hypothetical protein